MAILFLGLLQATAGLAIPANLEGTPTPSAGSQPPDAKRARQIAEEAFLKYTSRSVKTYSVKQVGDDRSHWEFFIQGTKKFARPGYHWIVKVNRESGAATVVAGE